MPESGAGVEPVTTTAAAPVLASETEPAVVVAGAGAGTGVGVGTETRAGAVVPPSALVDLRAVMGAPTLVQAHMQMP